MLDIRTKEQLKEVLAECYGDTRAAAKAFLPNRFWRPFDEEMHGRIFDLIDNSDNPQKVIAAPRGIGKTSIINLLLPFKHILYVDTPYIVPVSASSDLATQQAENLKMELMTNEIMLKLHGELATKQFNKRQWVVNPVGQEICVMPRGAGQQIRGLLYRDNRPSLILVDDLEDPENMDSEEQRKKKSDWFFADLMNCVDRGLGGKWEIIVLGTVLHQDALLVNLLDNPDWDSVVLEICDDDLKSKAPNFLPDREVIKLYEKYKTAGKLDVFYREYRNQPVPSGEDAAFPQAFFQSYDPTQVKLDGNPRVENVIIVDFAKTANPKSAHTAIVGVAVDVYSNVWYVRDIVHGKLHFDEIFTEIGDMARRIRPVVIGVEVTSLHEFATYPLKNELIRSGMPIEIVELHARGGDNERGKKKRVRSLIPFYRNGLVKHNPAVCRPLEAQLMSFPSPKRWDIMDALGYMPEMLEKGARYMLAGDPPEDESQTAVEREYDDLFEHDYAPHELEPAHYTPMI